MYKLHIVLSDKWGKEIIGEREGGKYFEMPFIPRVKDSIWLLNLPDDFWIGEEYAETAIVEEVFYNVTDFDVVHVYCKAEQSNR